MSEPYEEIIEGESLIRFPPPDRHERILVRLQERIASILGPSSPARLLPPRTLVQLSPGTLVRPDLALVTAANERLWLAAEVISPDDHRPDTVIKKQAYEDLNLPRLWMLDSRYDNAEVYHRTEYGLMLKGILAGKEVLEDPLLPGFKLVIRDLFDG
jgi:Uma2 family endonuclease